MKVTFMRYYSDRAKKGTIAETDKIKINKDTASGISVRVVGIWKKPQWFGSGWFKEFDGMYGRK